MYIKQIGSRSIGYQEKKESTVPEGHLATSICGDLQLASVPRSSSEAAAFKVSRREVNVRVSVWVTHRAIDLVTNIRQMPVNRSLLRVFHQKECHLRFRLADLSSLNAQG